MLKLKKMEKFGLQDEEFDLDPGFAVNGRLITLHEKYLLPEHLDNTKKTKGKLNRFKRSCLKQKSTLY